MQNGKFWGLYTKIEAKKLLILGSTSTFKNNLSDFEGVDLKIKKSFGPFWPKDPPKCAIDYNFAWRIRKNKGLEF